MSPLSAMNRTAAPCSLAGIAALTLSQGTLSNALSLTGSTYARNPTSDSRSASLITRSQASSSLKSVRTSNDELDLGSVSMTEV